ncbi:ISNCY-like element ISBj12 family transposase [Ramlibacter monticola]|uniref:Transposase family protein n=1 Tax=Ramlibacter monticola TaxID=1926872 RepID=A0A937CVC1_9BURK|nr:DDE-type integrase/transposase/recombinase [Ramlibacter monticola]MBL0394276.1 transposase family protein [Ramlibacter monticola]
MATRKELKNAVGARYREAAGQKRTNILDEFVAVTGYHRKHAIRVLGSTDESERPKQRRHRLYDEAVRQALIMLWEAADRLCGKRLKALLPMLIEAMERHGHLALDPIVRSKLLQVSAATMDRMLSEAKAQSGTGRRRRSGVGAAIRRSIPVRTFADWRNPPPGFFEVDMVEHCGSMKTGGDFVHTLVLTDIATGWTECIAMPVRNQSLVIEAFAIAAEELAFPMLGVDTDNDSAFMNQTVFDYCKDNRLEQTRSRAYRKNDQAWVEQKNGAIVRRLVGYGRLSGLTATQELTQLYSASRLYINFFQPSFKLKAKRRDGARVSKTYHPPATPCERLLASPDINDAVKTKLRRQFDALDPVALLRDIRSAQQRLTELSSGGAQVHAPQDRTGDLSTFLASLASAWKEGEVRPTHRQKPAADRWWRTRSDPFEHAWPVIEGWLAKEPTVTAKELMTRLAEMVPDAYAGTAQLRTLQRRIKAWRAEKAKDLILGRIRSTSRQPATADNESPRP